MAIITTRKLSELDKGYVLSPERYHPLRSVGHVHSACSLRDVADEIRIVTGSKRCPDLPNVICYDTCDAREGFFQYKSSRVSACMLQSCKKLFQPGDVIISRLRPYLRQIAYVPKEISEALPDCMLVCSTEFFVLRSKNRESIAFLVPFMLSSRVQAALSAGQEGGHHPRFTSEQLLSLGVPHNLLDKKKRVSDDVERLAAQYLFAQKVMLEMVESCYST